MAVGKREPVSAYLPKRDLFSAKAKIQLVEDLCLWSKLLPSAQSLQSLIDRQDFEQLREAD